MVDFRINNLNRSGRWRDRCISVNAVALTLVTFLPFVWSPQHFSKHLQLTELPPQLAEPALLVKLSKENTEEQITWRWRHRQCNRFSGAQCWVSLIFSCPVGLISDRCVKKQPAIQTKSKKICWCLVCHQNALSFYVQGSPGDGVYGTHRWPQRQKWDSHNVQFWQWYNFVPAVTPQDPTSSVANELFHAPAVLLRDRKAQITRFSFSVIIT